jgi:hypothetical protein
MKVNSVIFGKMGQKSFLHMKRKILILKNEKYFDFQKMDIFYVQKIKV